MHQFNIFVFILLLLVIIYDFIYYEAQSFSILDETTKTPLLFCRETFWGDPPKTFYQKNTLVVGV